MLSVMVAKWVADALTHSLYHAIIEAKCLPFLSPEVALHGARDGDLEMHTINDLLAALADGGGHGGGDNAVADGGAAPGAQVHTLRSGSNETYGSCAQMLSETSHGAYPLVDEQGRFEGSISRGQLLAVLAQGFLQHKRRASARGEGGRTAAPGGGAPLNHLQLLEREEEVTRDGSALRSEAVAYCLSEPSLSMAACDLAPYMNASAFSLRADFSLHRAYMLFRTMGLRHLVVTDVANHVVGVLTRRDLMDFRLHDVLHPHGHGHGGGHDHGHGGESHAGNGDVGGCGHHAEAAAGEHSPSSVARSAISGAI